MGVCLFLMSSMPAHAQRIGLKTNALYWAAMSPNMGAEQMRKALAAYQPPHASLWQRLKNTLGA